MQERDAVSFEKAAQGAEKGRVLVDPDMLEHADRDDAVVIAGLFPVIAQMKPHAVGKPGRFGPPVRHLVLLLGEGEAGDVAVAFSREVEREAAPARPDVEHLVAGPQQELGRNMPFLVALGGVEVVVGRAEVGARILPVAVEEELVELVRQIVVVSNVAAGSRHRIVLVEASHQAPGRVAQSQQRRMRQCDVVRHQQVDKVVKRPFLDRQGAVHIGLAD
jgi:hypothetical protein